MSSSRLERLKRAFAPEAALRSGELISKEIARFLTEAMRPSSPARPWSEPWELVKIADQELERGSSLEAADPSFLGRLQELCSRAMEPALRLHSPLNMGHQVAPPIPVSGTFEAVGSVLNQACGVYEVGPFALAAEKALIARMGAKLGWAPGEFDAIGTHGGSIANLTAILCARNIRYPNAWADGTRGSAKVPALLTSSDSHYSVARAAGIIGIGSKQVLPVPVDSQRRIRPDALIEKIEEAERSGFEVFCIVGSACTTSTGAFDPLRAVGEISRARGIWFHVDGAHGASLLLSPNHRHRLDGIELADSVTWDAHKMMFVPSLSTFLFFREKAKSWLSFQQEAPYLLDRDAATALEFDGAYRTLECTKRPLSLGLWAAWSLYGETLFEDLVDQTLEIGRTFFELLSKTADFRPLHEPECNILCFQHVPSAHQNADPKVRSALQSEIRSRLLKEGQHYITLTRVGGEAALRVTLMNPFTTERELLELMDSIRRVARPQAVAESSQNL